MILMCWHHFHWRRLLSHYLFQAQLPFVDKFVAFPLYKSDCMSSAIKFKKEITFNINSLNCYYFFQFQIHCGNKSRIKRKRTKNQTTTFGKWTIKIAQIVAKKCLKCFNWKKKSKKKKTKNKQNWCEMRTFDSFHLRSTQIKWKNMHSWDFKVGNPFQNDRQRDEQNFWMVMGNG